MTRNQQQAEALCAHIAKALDLVFVRGYGDAELSDAAKIKRQSTHILFRDNADGTITFAACGLLPSIWRERPNKALLTRFEDYLEAIGATRRADFMRDHRLRVAREAAILAEEERARVALEVTSDELRLAERGKTEEARQQRAADAPLGRGSVPTDNAEHAEGPC